MTDIREVLDSIQRRADAATRGPWEVDANAVRPSVWAWECLALTYPTGSTPAPRHRANAEFISHARADVPRLVAALRAVLDLHQRWDAQEPWCAHCIDVLNTYVDWPCRTVAAITEALGGDA